MRVLRAWREAKSSVSIGAKRRAISRPQAAWFAAQMDPSFQD
jgi:hypothetical protein